jgi:hypothetical protein
MAQWPSFFSGCSVKWGARLREEEEEPRNPCVFFLCVPELFAPKPK